MSLCATSFEAKQLMHEGAQALSAATIQGMCVDVSYVEKQMKHLEMKCGMLTDEFSETPLGRKWLKSFSQTNLNSDDQLREILFEKEGLTPLKMTKASKRFPKGQPSVDNETLELISKTSPDIISYITYKKLKKVRDTFLSGILREQVDGILHPFFHLHKVKTFRSCVAKGTEILVMRDFKKTGIPIEDVQKGDFVYCFDDDLNPRIREVKWSGKTGYREVIRLHWKAGKGREGYLDVTPEHLIRHISGEYIPAEDFMGDLRSPTESKHAPKARALACSRKKDFLRFTGHMENGRGIPEYHLIYEYFHGKIKNDKIIHHKDNEHYNHLPDNLAQLSRSEHSSLHENFTDADRAIALEKRRDGIRTGRITFPEGKDHPLHKGYSRKDCLRLLREAKGNITKVEGVCFSTFKSYLDEYDIDPSIVKLKYDVHGKKISKKRLKKLAKKGIRYVQKRLGINYYKIKKLYDLYNIEETKIWRNQNGSGERHDSGNHVITRIERLHKKVDVYDLEVDEFHNFFANEICVHNSSSNINFHNQPNRDKLQKNIVRASFIPRPGFHFMACDFSGIEVAIGCCYHKDPKMLEYVRHPELNNMHTDLAVQLYQLDKFVKDGSEKMLRKGAKNGFVFPAFYGDYYVNAAASLAAWGKLPTKGKFSENDGRLLCTGIKLGQHFINKGCPDYESFLSHVQAVENDFWNNRFIGYRDWKKRNVTKYYRKGFLETLTGFTCSGEMGPNDINNYPIQGSAFHALLRTYIEVFKKLNKKGFRSKLIGQIHDELVGDIHPAETYDVLFIMKYIATEWIRKHYPWIIVPLVLEAAIFDVDANWSSSSRTLELTACGAREVIL